MMKGDDKVGFVTRYLIAVQRIKSNPIWTDIEKGEQILDLNVRYAKEAREDKKND